MSDPLAQLLEQRFGQPFPAADLLPKEQAAALAALAGQSSLRHFSTRPVPDDLLKLLCACALSAPSKSDLQLRDIVVIRDPARKAALVELVPTAAWMAEAPVILIFCGNAGRLESLMRREAQPFPNNHADLLVNAVADAAISLSWMQAAANLAGLGGCAISGLRDWAGEVAELMGLGPLTLPFAGFALGWPEGERPITPRLPLSQTFHQDRLAAADDACVIAEYDAYRKTAGVGSWSGKRARQYSAPLRPDFGAFLRGQGFRLDKDPT